MLVSCQLLHHAACRKITVAVTQHPPLADCTEAGLRHSLDNLPGKAVRQKLLEGYGWRLPGCSLPVSQPQQKPFLGLFPLIELFNSLGGQPIAHGQIALIAFLCPLAGGIDPAHQLVLQQPFQNLAQLGGCLRHAIRFQLLPQLLFLGGTGCQKSLIDLAVHIHHQQHIVPHIRHSLILQLDFQPAFPRHKKPHHLSHRAQIKISQPFGSLNHPGGKPRLLIHRRLDVFQLFHGIGIFHLPVSFHRADLHHKSLNIPAAKGHQHTPACPQPAQLRRYPVAEGTGYALDRNIYIHISNLHIITSQRKNNWLNKWVNYSSTTWASLP